MLLDAQFKPPALPLAPALPAPLGVAAEGATVILAGGMGVVAEGNTVVRGKEAPAAGATQYATPARRLVQLSLMVGFRA